MFKEKCHRFYVKDGSDIATESTREEDREAGMRSSEVSSVQVKFGNAAYLRRKGKKGRIWG